MSSLLFSWEGDQFSRRLSNGGQILWYQVFTWIFYRRDIQRERRTEFHVDLRRAERLVRECSGRTPCQSHGSCATCFGEAVSSAPKMRRRVPSEIVLNADFAQI
jgi:hypothetical protein